MRPVWDHERRMTALKAEPAEAPPPPEPAGPRNFGGYVGAFDGMRGIGLAAVLLYHGGYTLLPGAYFSISMFFTLSGFLITMLMIKEVARSGRIALGAFWLRRARRLLPAALFTLIGVLVLRRYFSAIGPDRLRGDVLAALGYIENWWLIHTNQAYGAIFSEGSPVQHFWSLAIEEQYYLVFPLLMVALHRVMVRNLRIAAVLAALTAASFAYAASLSSNLDHAYYNTLSRASEILFGILAAFLVAQLDRDRTARARQAIDAVAVAALVGMAWLWSSIDLHDSFVFRGGTLLNSVFTCIVIVACLQPGLVARFLNLAPIRRFGSISYGVYLVHWPIFLILDEHRLDLGHNTTFGVRVAVTLAVAIAMYHLFENPIRRGKLLPRAHVLRRHRDRYRRGHRPLAQPPERRPERARPLHRVAGERAAARPGQHAGGRGRPARDGGRRLPELVGVGRSRRLGHGPRRAVRPVLGARLRDRRARHPRLPRARPQRVPGLRAVAPGHAASGALVPARHRVRRDGPRRRLAPQVPRRHVPRHRRPGVRRPPHAAGAAGRPHPHVDRRHAPLVDLPARGHPVQLRRHRQPAVRRERPGAHRRARTRS